MSARAWLLFAASVGVLMIAVVTEVLWVEGIVGAFAWIPLLLGIVAVIDLVTLMNASHRTWGAVELLWLIVATVLFIVGPLAWLLSGRRAYVVPGAGTAEEQHDPGR